MVDAGELRFATFGDYHRSCGGLIRAFGADRDVESLTPQDFEALRASMAETRGPMALAKQIQQVRTILKYAYESGMIAQPMRFGTEFRKPSRRSMRLARAATPRRMFTAAQIRAQIRAARMPLRAMILLAVNCGWAIPMWLSCQCLRLISIEVWWIFRGPRRVSNDEQLCGRNQSKLCGRQLLKGRVLRIRLTVNWLFLTKYGACWCRVQMGGDRSNNGELGVMVNSVGLEYGKLLRQLGQKAPRGKLLCLRHVFETIAGKPVTKPPWTESWGTRTTPWPRIIESGSRNNAR